ncbi:MAG: hypothetical protein LBL47_00860 [Lactobacillus sp.]|jgi:hypothetical protein|nr:hypothetical protein [Lactobacillus sp.]
MATTIPSAGNLIDGKGSWEKTIVDMNNVDEIFSNARDVGYLRLNYSRTNVVAKLGAKYDALDMYKVQVQSNGKMKLSLKSTSSTGNEPVLDLSKYADALDAAEKMIDPEGWAKKQAEKAAAATNYSIMENEAPGLRLQVYTVKNGKEVLVADSHAEYGSKEYKAANEMLTGEYKAKKGDYYVKVSRDDDTPVKEEIAYALQMQVGTTYKHDYIVTETASDDYKNKTISKIPLTTDYTGTLSAVNALEIQASKYSATADMLASGYLNLASIYNNKK